MTFSRTDRGDTKVVVAESSKGANACSVLHSAFMVFEANNKAPIAPQKKESRSGEITQVSQNFRRKIGFIIETSENEWASVITRS